MAAEAASIQGIEFMVRGSTAEAVDALTQLKQTLSGLKRVGKNLDLSPVIGEIEKLAKSLKRIDRGTVAKLNAIGNALNGLQGSGGGLAGAIGGAGGNGLGRVNRDLTKTIKNTTKLGRLLTSIGRIGFYRLIRFAIKSITETFDEGTRNAYFFSEALESHEDGAIKISTAYDYLASANFKMTNQLGAAWASFVRAITPQLMQLLSVVTSVANAITQLFAALAGRGTYLQALDYNKKWAYSAGQAAKAAKEWKNQLMGFDEINRLEEPAAGGGGGDEGPDYGRMFEETPIADWLRKLQELVGSLKLSIDDVLFDWSDLNPEQIAEKAVAGLCGLLGGVTGFLFGGAGGALFGTIAGVGIGLLIDSLVFNHDGVLSRGEIGDLVSMALLGLTGGIVGFFASGMKGALIGASICIGLFAIIKGIDFATDGKTGALLENLTIAMGALAGASIGLKLGGPLGAVIGATIGFGVSFFLKGVVFADTGGWSTGDWVKNIVAALAPLAGAMIGLAVGGPAGAAVGAVIGLGIRFLLKTDPKAEGEQTAQGFFDGITEKFKDIGNWVKEHVTDPLVEAVKNLLGIHSPSTVFAEIGKMVVEGLWSGFRGQWNDFLRNVQGAWQGLKQWWSGLRLDSFLFRLPHLQVQWEELASNSIIATVLGITAIPHLSVAWYARGGIVDGATLIGAGEQGKEAIIPLERNTQWIANVADELYARLRMDTAADMGAEESAQDVSEDVVTAIYAMGEQLIRAIQASGSGGGYDPYVIAREVSRIQRQTSRSVG